MERQSIDKVEVNVSDGGQLNLALDNGQIHAAVNNSERNHVKSNIHSRTVEYLNKWNNNMFLNDFNKRDENAGVNISLKELYVEKHLPHYLWKDNKNKFDDLKNLLLEYMDKNSNKEINNKMLFILGQPGIGKSTLITWITAHFIDNIINNINDILVYQFASDLKNVDWQNSSDKYNIADEILKELNLSYDNLEGKTLIIDGFDEIIVGGNRTKIINDIYHQWIKENSINKFSLIITCREHYIEDLQKMDCDYITLQTFDKKQIKSFCTVYQEKNNSSISKDTIENIIKNQDILGIPLILYMILALNISIEKEGSLATVYNQIFSIKDGGIYNRCLQNKRYEMPHRISQIKEQIHLISQKIAFWMFENNSEEAYIPQKEYQEICNRVIQENKQKNQDILIGNFFKTIKHCEGIESERLSFVHRSIYEYFVAEYIFRQICISIKKSKEELASIFGKLLKKEILSSEIRGFLKFKIETSELNSMFDIVCDVFNLMLSDGMTYYTRECYKNVMDCEIRVFANMLDTVHLWDENIYQFNGYIINYIKHNLNAFFLDLSKINLQGANLFEANLQRVNFFRASLKNVTFWGANLQGVFCFEVNLQEADLQLANLRKVDLQKANLQRADLQKADLRKTNLQKANLQKVNLQGANLKEANLRLANLQRSDLRLVNLQRTDLRGANLQGSNLQGTYLQNSIWTSSDIVKILPQLKEAEFEYIFVQDENEMKKIYKNELFS